MNKNFWEDDHKFLMHMGQENDSSGFKTKRQAKNVEYNLAKNQKRNNKDMEAAQKNAEKNARLSRISLIFDKNVIASLKGQKLQDQLDAFRLADAPLHVLAKDVKAVADKEKLSTMLFISMRVINGPQLVLRMEKQRVFRLMIMKNRMRRKSPVYAQY